MVLLSYQLGVLFAEESNLCRLLEEIELVEMEYVPYVFQHLDQVGDGQFAIESVMVTGYYLTLPLAAYSNCFKLISIASFGSRLFGGPCISTFC